LNPTESDPWVVAQVVPLLRLDLVLVLPGATVQVRDRLDVRNYAPSVSFALMDSLCVFRKRSTLSISKQACSSISALKAWQARLFN